MGGLSDFLNNFRDEVHHASAGDFECAGLMLQVEWVDNQPRIVADALLKDSRSDNTHLVRFDLDGPPSAWAVRGAKDAVQKAVRMENAA